MAEYRRGDRISWLVLGTIIGFLLGAAFVVVGGLFFIRAQIKSKQVVLPAPVADRTVSKNMINLSFEDKDEIYIMKPAEFTTAQISEDYASVGSHSLLVKMKAGEGFPGIGWSAQGRESLDFSQAKGFGFDVYNPSDYYVKLEVKFKSGFGEGEATQSFHVTLKPYEWNKISIPTSQIAEACDLREISYVKIFLIFPAQDIALYFDNFRVE